MQQDPQDAKGYEVISFEATELTRTEGGEITLIGIGTLFVLLFQDFRRFVLRINNWSYALFPKLKLTASNKDSPNGRSYQLPALDSCYTIKLSKTANHSAVLNFETILSHAARLNYLPSSVGELTPSEASQEIFANFSQAYLVANGEEINKLHGIGRVKQEIANVAQKISRVLLRPGKQNLNLTKVRDFGSIKAIDREVMPVHEFPRSEIDELISTAKTIAVNSPTSSNSITDVSFSCNSILSDEPLNQSTMNESTLNQITRSHTTNIPIPETEEEIIAEIAKQRILQAASRRIQEESRASELQSLDRERELMELTRREQEARANLEIEHKELELKVELYEREITLEEQQRTMESDRARFEAKERLLLEEIGARLVQLREKEKLSLTEQIEFTRKEQQLIAMNEDTAQESLNIRRINSEMRERALRRDLEVQEKEKLTAAQREEYIAKEQALRDLIEERLAELRDQELLTEAERIELQRREAELLVMSQLKELEQQEFDRKRQEFIEEIEQRMAVLRAKELMTEAERLEFEAKKRELESEIEARLADLRLKEQLTEAERRELAAKELRLEELTQSTDFERIELQIKENQFFEETAIREAALQEKQIFTEAEKIQLNSIRNRLIKEIEITEIEKVSLEIVKNKIFADAELREARLIEREQLTAAERRDLQIKEMQAMEEIERRLAILREKERLTEEERVEVERKERELATIVKVQHLDTDKQRRQLKKIREREAEMLAQNQAIVLGQIEAKEELEQMEKEVNNPAEFAVAVERISERQNVVRSQRVTEKKTDRIEIAEETTTCG